MHRTAPQRERVYLRRSLAPSDQVYTAPRAPPTIACPLQPGDKEERAEDVRRMLNTFERRVVYGLRPSVKARPAPVHSIPAEASRREPSATAPDELVKRVLASGLYLPCEAHGATVVERCHQNTSGAAAGFYDMATRTLHEGGHASRLEHYTSWGEIDFAALDADWTMTLGEIGGRAFQFGEVKERLLEEREQSCVGYGVALARARAASRADADAFNALSSEREYVSFGAKVHSLASRLPAGRRPPPPQLARQSKSDLVVLYRQAWSALPGLWRLATRIRQLPEIAGGAAEIHWGIKPLRRLRHKLAEKYTGQSCMATDLARVSVVLPSLAHFKAALDFVLENYVVLRFKNRLAAPTADGYRDALLNIKIKGHVTELQLHVADLYALRTTSPGVSASYRWLRRLERSDEDYTGAPSLPLPLPPLPPPPRLATAATAATATAAAPPSCHPVVHGW